MYARLRVCGTPQSSPQTPAIIRTNFPRMWNRYWSFFSRGRTIPVLSLPPATSNNADNILWHFSLYPLGTCITAFISCSSLLLQMTKGVKMKLNLQCNDVPLLHTAQLGQWRPAALTEADRSMLQVITVPRDEYWQLPANMRSHTDSSADWQLESGKSKRYRKISNLFS